MADLSRARHQAGAYNLDDLVPGGPAPALPPPLPPLTANDIVVLQQALQAAGFNPGGVDGRWGPKTQAALQSFQKANNWPVTSEYDPGTRYRFIALFQYLGNQPAAQAAPPPMRPTGGGGRGGGSMPAVPTTGASAPPPVDWAAIKRLKDSGMSEDDIFLLGAQTKYPQLAGLVNIPEIRPILIEAAKGGWTGEQLQARVQATEWWRSTPAQSRAWTLLNSTDPATAARMVEDSKKQYEQMAKAYLVPLSDEALTDWTLKTISGQVSADAFTGYLTEQAKSRFPSLAAALDSGITVRQYAEPYVQLAARELEIAPDSIDLMDGKWLRALDTVDPTSGQRVSMSLADWQSEIRQNEVYGWDRTTNAVTQATEFRNRLEQAFGLRG